MIKRERLSPLKVIQTLGIKGFYKYFFPQMEEGEIIKHNTEQGHNAY